MEQKKVVLVSSFCDNQKKLDVLEKNLKIIKALKIDIILISPFFLPKNIVDLCDYFFVTKDNKVLDWPTKVMVHWRAFFKNGTTYRLSTTFPDYGFAGLYQVKQLSEIALTMEYDQFIHMIYDIKIDYNVLDGLFSNKDYSIYPSKRDNTIWPVGLHFMIFNRDNLKRFISKITEENYLRDTSLDALFWVHSLKEELKYNTENIPVEDEIYYHEGIDLYNSSPTEKLKFFIEKNSEKTSTVKLFFYGNSQEKRIKISVSSNEKIYDVNNFDIIDLGFNEGKIETTKLEVDDETYDLTPIIQKIKQNHLRIENKT